MLCISSRHILPATTTAELWSVLEDEDERENADEPSHAKRPLVLFICPPLPPPELRPTAPVVGLKLTPPRHPQKHQHPIRLPRLHHRCHCRGGGGGCHSHNFGCHPHGCSPRGCDCRCLVVPPGCVPPTLPPGFDQKTGSGVSSWAISKALTWARVGAAPVCPT